MKYGAVQESYHGMSEVSNVQSENEVNGKQWLYQINQTFILFVDKQQ